MLPDELLRSVSTYAGPRAAANLGATSRTARSIFKPDAFRVEQVKSDLLSTFRQFATDVSMGLIGETVQTLELYWEMSADLFVPRIRSQLYQLAMFVQTLENTNDDSAVHRELRDISIRYQRMAGKLEKMHSQKSAFETILPMIAEIESLMERAIDMNFRALAKDTESMSSKFNMARRRTSSRRRSTRRKSTRRSVKKSIKKRKTSARRKSPKRR